MMDFVKRLWVRRTFGKLFFSYMTITVIITLFLGSSLFYFFSNRYNAQVIAINNKIIEQHKNTLEVSVLGKIQNLYANIASNNLNTQFNEFIYFFNHPAAGNNIGLYSNTEYLKNLRLSYGDIVQGIHLYIPNNNLILSSTWGVQFLHDKPQDAIDTLDWFVWTKNPPATGKWIETRPLKNAFTNDTGDNGISYLRVFPLFSQNIGASGMLVIDVNEITVSTILKNSRVSAEDHSFIINADGKVIFSPDTSQLYTDLHTKSYIQKILDGHRSAGNFTSRLDGVDTMISYMAVQPTGWMIVNCTPINIYYSQTSIIRQIILLFCILAFVVGFIFTWIFSKNMYNPLKALLLRVKALGENDTGTASAQNEYLQINKAITTLSSKVNTLEKDICEYQPIVTQNLFLSLLNNAVPSKKELAGFLKLCSLQLRGNFSTCLLLHFNQKELKDIELQKCYYIFYMTIKHIEHMQGDDYAIYALMLSPGCIGVIINADSALDSLITELEKKTSAFVYEQFHLKINLAVGNWTSDLLNLHISYEQARTSLQHKFYYPLNRIIYFKEVEADEFNCGNPNLFPEDAFFHTFNLQSLPAAMQYFESFMNTLLTHPYSYGFRMKKLMELIDRFHTFCRNMDMEDYFLLTDLYSEFDALEDILDFSHWFQGKITVVFELLEDKSHSRIFETIEKAKEYIDSNYALQLSLESVSQFVGLTPKYFSKLFKKTTGINFQEYITTLRMEKSKDLLLTTKLTVEQISRQVGYYSPAYFIRQFKQSYGDTPNSYRSAKQLDKEGSRMMDETANCH